MNKITKLLFSLAVVVAMLLPGAAYAALTSPTGGSGLVSPASWCLVASGVWQPCNTADVTGDSSNKIADGYYTALTVDTLTVPTALILTGSITADLQIDDDIEIQLGTTGDIVMVLNSAGLAADAELAGVIVGTSDHQGTAANSFLLSNITTDGDMLFLVSDGGNSLEFLNVNGDTADLQVGHGMALVTIKTASGDLTLAPGSSNTEITGTLDVSTTIELGSSNIVLNTSTGLVLHEAGGIELDISSIGVGDVLAGDSAGVIAIIDGGASSDGDVLTIQSDGKVLFETPAVGGDVTGDSASADKEFVRFNSTTGKVIESPVTDLATTTATLGDNADVTFYDAVNDGNPVFSFGSSATNDVIMSPVYNGGAQTIDHILFESTTASATADDGEFRFNVDGALSLTIDDGGIELPDAHSYFIDTSEVLNETTLGSSVVASSLTSVGTLLTLTVDDITLNANTIISGGASDFDIDPAGGQSLVLDGALDIDGAIMGYAGVFTNTGALIVLTADLTIGATSANELEPALKIIGDADSDGAGDTDDTLTLKLTGAADPTNATWDFSSTQSGGYKFDKSVTLTGGGVVGVDGTISKLQLTENTSISLDEDLGGDTDYSGTTISGTGGATIAFGDLIFLDASAGEWLLTDADAVATAGDVIIGMAVTTSTNGNPVTILLQGTIRSATFPASIALGDTFYVGLTPGDIVVAAPSATDDVVRVVGWAVTVEPNTVYFNPSQDHITII